MSPQADTREVSILCDAADNALFLQSGTITESLGELFEFSLNLWSLLPELDLAYVVGKPLTVKVQDSENTRYFHGVVCEMAALMQLNSICYYRAVVRPTLWTLGQSSGCRSFENMSVHEIVQECLLDGKVEIGKVAVSKVRFDHCVQYRETDLHFVSRMMERHGLYYFFEHSEKKHTMRVAANVGDHDDRGAIEFVDYVDGNANPSQTYLVESWEAATRLRSSSYNVAGSENLTRKGVFADDKTRFKVKGAEDLAIADFEAVDEIREPFLDELSRVRMEAIDATAEEYQGTTRDLMLGSGMLFTLERHPRADQCKEYLVVAATHHLEAPPPPHDAGDDYTVWCDFNTTFTAIDAETPYRPQIRHAKPRVAGPQLATVSEETDEYGRVKVDFQWGGSNSRELVSFWTRVSQNWAGNQWGGMFLPHVGQEVIVEFVDGDPDQPLITGRVYNKESMPPLSLPANKHKSIIRDHGSNELMMDGTDGSQQIRLYCPNHESEIWLGRSIELKSLSDHRNVFGGDWLTEISGDRSTEIQGGESKTIMKDVVENIIGNMKTKVGADVAQQKLGAFHETIAGLTSKFIGGTKKETVVGLEVKKLIGGKNEKVEGPTHKDGTSIVETYKEAKKTIQGHYTKKAKETYTEVEKTIKQKANDYLIGAKMLKQDVEKALEVKANDYKIGVEMLKQDVKKSYELKAKKAKHAIVGAALLAASKFSVNDGNLDVKK